ncbi:D-alanyl-D-alanine carboxypeptidase family protein [Desmospora activa]|uniref:serine-type D-Ala-D-Ala carboxypeptidase n=1 Tax=Desmospora activa DSM 45169 TaxID=1121389 RepID=A0A2T4Z9M6_9BACL|nr:D-alanyl-D-alanine carboxypeptidase family protein [Desmospora activa]PTM58601.1 D-Ala-D-Ala carboxypeptidase DacF [Desmospora activa DSM 45169]
MQMRFFMGMLVSFLTLSAAVPTPLAAAAEGELNLAPDARSAILLDADTGTILYEKNSDESLPPASVTKIMTMLLIIEALDHGKISFDDSVRISEHAASMGGSQIYLEPGEAMTVKDLFKAVAVGSANDASVALAEHIAGTEEAFVAQMNERAAKLGMKNTRFQNPNGLPAKDHHTSAKDIAVMSRELLKHKGVTEFTRIYEDYLRKETDNPFWLVNTNRLVKFYEGMDGLKTGFTAEAKYCLSATAKRGNFRLIAVVMGEPNPKARNRETTRMLDYAFSQFTNHVVYRQGDPIAHLHVDKGLRNQIDVRAPQQFSILIKKGENPDQYRTRLQWEELKAPIQKGERLGRVLVEKDGKVVSQLELLSARDIPRAGSWTLFKRTLKKMLFLPEEAPPVEEVPK